MIKKLKWKNYLSLGNLELECDSYIAQCSQYDRSKHEKIDNSYQNHHYRTLPTYIRNAIDYRDSRRNFTEAELKVSIELLIELCR